LDVELRRDPRIEAAPGDGNRERVLSVIAARLNALVTEDALRVVADVQRVVDLHRLLNGLGLHSVYAAVMTRVTIIAVRERTGRGPESVGVSLVSVQPALDGCPRQGEIGRGRQKLENEFAGMTDPLAVGCDRHPVLDLSRAGRDQRAAALDFDHAHPARVDRCQRLEVAQRRLLLP
jgi:hypothetical protein